MRIVAVAVARWCGRAAGQTFLGKASLKEGFFASFVQPERLVVVQLPVPFAAIRRPLTLGASAGGGVGCRGAAHDAGPGSIAVQPPLITFLNSTARAVSFIVMASTPQFSITTLRSMWVPSHSM